jgi:hypothetical protein
MDDFIEDATKAKKAVVAGLDYIIDMARLNASQNCCLVSQNCKLIELNKVHCKTIELQSKRIEELTNFILNHIANEIDDGKV